MHPCAESDPTAAVGLAPAFREVVRKRRSTYAYLDHPVAAAVIEQALRDAVLAPNHHRTAPWRFFVVPVEARERLVRAYVEAASRLGRDPARAEQRARDAPVNVVVACVPALGNPRVRLAEEEFACAAAVQTFMLSLAAAGVDSLLTTGELAESPEVAALVGLSAPGSRVMALINVGYRNPQRVPSPRPDSPLDQVVTWLGPDGFPPERERNDE